MAMKAAIAVFASDGMSYAKFSLLKGWFQFFSINLSICLIYYLVEISLLAADDEYLPISLAISGISFTLLMIFELGIRLINSYFTLGISDRLIL
jgi:hypothetical protein